MNRDSFFPNGLIQFLLTFLFVVCVDCPIIILLNDVEEGIMQNAFFVIICVSFLLVVCAINVRKKNNIFLYYTKRIDSLWLTLLIVVVIQCFISQPIAALLCESNAGEINNLPIMLGSLFIAPFFEELIFRGVLLRGLLTRYSSLFSIVLSSLIFAIIHIRIVQIVPAFLLGILFSIIFVRTHSLLHTIILHFFANTLTWFFAFVHLRNFYQNFNYILLVTMVGFAFVLYVCCAFKLQKQLCAKCN